MSSSPNYGNRPHDDDGVVARLIRALFRPQAALPELGHTRTTPPAPEPGHAADDAQKKSDNGFARRGSLKLSGRAALLANISICNLIGGIVLMAIFSPAHALLSACLTLPFAIALAAMPVRIFSGMVRGRLADTPAGASRQVRIYWTLGWVSMMGGLLWTANVVFDAAPAESRVLTVSGKHYSTGRHGSHHYYADVPYPMSVMGEVWATTEAVTVDSGFYNTLVPGREEIVLSVHPGFLGLSWYGSNHAYREIDTAVPTLQNDPATWRHLNALLEQFAQPDAARLNDDLSRRAAALSDSMLAVYQRSSGGDREVLNQADLALSHIRWEYVYDRLDPVVFSGLTGQLASIAATQAPAPAASQAWESQVNEKIKENREIVMHRSAPH
jgi:hypothetical protein